MNPNVEPPQPPQPHRSSTSCDRHPEEHFTGFCPSCLCERLAVLEPSSAAASSSSSRKPPIAATTSTATAALKAIFKASGGGGTRPAFFPELRRTKSFSASKNEGLSGAFEPQRKSCDVRVRNTLWSLFYQDDERNPHKKEAAGNGRYCEIVEVEARTLGSSSSVVQGPVFESKEEYKNESETDHEDDIEIIEEEQPNVAVPHASLIEEKVEAIVEEYEKELYQEEELKPMKDHIDLDSQTKKASGRDFKEIAGSFWSAASVFSKKLQKWRQNQKLKKRRNGGGSARLPVEKPTGRQYRETQSEIADYGFGRRSCDTDPRFSLDAGRMSFDAVRMSFDDPRYSFDEPRASWDGHLTGRTFPRMPTMVSVVEDAPVHHVMRSDTQIPVEDPPAMNSIDEDESRPGGSAQTRDYYSDSSSRRRKSLDRSGSIRKTAAAVVGEIDEMKSVSNAKVSPATVDYFHGPKLVVPDRDSNSNSLRDDYSEAFEIGFRDNASVIGNGERKGSSKKSRRWSIAWNIWGFIHRSVNKDEDEDRYSRANGVERSYSESWPELRGERNGDVRGGFNPKVLRSNSSVSWRNSSSFGGARKKCVEPNGHSKKRDEFVLEKNRSARYSPNNIDNGLLRFYLTPMRSSRRVGSGKSKASHAHSIARSAPRLY
ncbi:UPF0503 protein At3g09070, chloroplastic-like [Durio zibethinus]|uniref:UPF0503 protein At3g09070, chloroplastic-like n=1 Tax=Durio zibethinus TaxID=66656 RepID=A0A6P5YX40_DURZI|nr:UPF0503 protein At3g09070, chloroplastic-like [Durio zibethinus]